MIYQKIQNSKNEEQQNCVNESKKQSETLTQKVLKEQKPPKLKKKKNDISEESQNKLDIIMNITNNICN